MSRGMSRAALHVATMRSERPRSDQQYCAKRQNGSLPTGAQQASIRARLSSLGGYGRIVTSKARGWQGGSGRDARRIYRSVRASIARRENTDRSRGAAESINALTLGSAIPPFGVSKWTG